MDLFNVDIDAFLSFLLTFMRLSLVLFLMPIFGGESIPHSVKAALCLVLTLAVWPHLALKPEHMPAHPFEMAAMLFGELLLGLVLGLMIKFLFAAVQTGGEIIGFQMGFSMVNVIDPVTGVSEAVTAHFLYMVTTLVFLTLNGHLVMLQALAQTFDYIPPGHLMLNPELARHVLKFSGIMFSMAVQIAAPIMAALFLVDLALALISKAAPQMHILLFGFPIKISVGFLFLGVVFSMLSMYIRGFVDNMNPMFTNLLAAGL